MAKTSTKKAKAEDQNAGKKTGKKTGKKPAQKSAELSTRMAGYVVLLKGKPLALSVSEGTPKNGVLERNERATLFTRLQGAQGAINRTVKHGEGKKGALNPDNCQIVRVDHLPAA